MFRSYGANRFIEVWFLSTFLVPPGPTKTTTVLYARYLYKPAATIDSPPHKWFDSPTSLSGMSFAAQTNGSSANDKRDPQLCDLFLFTAGGRTFAVSSAEVDGTAEAKKPTPLPQAPGSILGVVYARGRMLTLVDPAAVTSGEPLNWPLLIPAIISLRGDEQLALAAESLGEAITVSSSDISPADGETEAETSQAIAGVLRHGGEKITILDPAELFNVAVQRKDRRRRRF